MPSSTRKLQSWTDQRIERELREFLVGRDEWPSYRDFQRAGRKVLRDAVTQLGGACHWARRLGVTYVERKPGYPFAGRMTASAGSSASSCVAALLAAPNRIRAIRTQAAAGRRRP